MEHDQAKRHDPVSLGPNYVYKAYSPILKKSDILLTSSLFGGYWTMAAAEERHGGDCLACHLLDGRRILVGYGGKAPTIRPSNVRA